MYFLFVFLCNIRGRMKNREKFVRVNSSLHEKNYAEFELELGQVKH